MRVVKAFVTLRPKLVFTSCKRCASIFRFKLGNPISMRTLIHRRRPCHLTPGKPSTKKRLPSLFSGFINRDKKEMDSGLKELGSDRTLPPSPVTPGKKLYPSPVTPAYARTRKVSRKDAVRDRHDVEDACRSFENCLVQMIVEERRVKDLTDIEELLYCWKNLRSRVFIDLVARFYRELCQDLFSADDDDENKDGGNIRESRR